MHRFPARFRRLLGLLYRASEGRPSPESFPRVSGQSVCKACARPRTGGGGGSGGGGGGGLQARAGAGAGAGGLLSANQQSATEQPRVQRTESLGCNESSSAASIKNSMIRSSNNHSAPTGEQSLDSHTSDLTRTGSGGVRCSLKLRADVLKAQVLSQSGVFREQTAGGGGAPWPTPRHGGGRGAPPPRGSPAAFRTPQQPPPRGGGGGPPPPRGGDWGVSRPADARALERLQRRYCPLPPRAAAGSRGAAGGLPDEEGPQGGGHRPEEADLCCQDRYLVRPALEVSETLVNSGSVLATGCRATMSEEDEKVLSRNFDALNHELAARPAEPPVQIVMQNSLEESSFLVNFGSLVGQEIDQQQENTQKLCTAKDDKEQSSITDGTSFLEGSQCSFLFEPPDDDDNSFKVFPSGGAIVESTERSQSKQHYSSLNESSNDEEESGGITGECATPNNEIVTQVQEAELSKITNKIHAACTSYHDVKDRPTRLVLHSIDDGEGQTGQLYSNCSENNTLPSEEGKKQQVDTCKSGESNTVTQSDKLAVCAAQNEGLVGGANINIAFLLHECENDFAAFSSGEENEDEEESILHGADD